MKGVEVKNMSLGRGVFATGKFRQGQVVGSVDGDIIADPAYDSDYCIEIDQGRSLEPATPFRYLNHSCQPNCEIVMADEQPQGQADLWVEALRPIAPGDELTIDYGWPAHAAIPCQCGCPECRGWVVDAAQLDRLPARPA